MTRHVCCCAVLALAACGGKSAATPAVAIDSLAGGIPHVANRAPERWADTSGWKLVLERTIHPLAGEPGELIKPRHLVASDRGDLYVVDQEPIVIKHFNALGAFVGLVSRQGSGPGEISYGMPYITHDTLVYQDPGQARMLSFSADGRYLATWPATTIAGSGLVADDSGRIPVPISTGATAINSGHAMARYRLGGVIVDTIRIPSAPEPSVWRLKTDHADMGALVPFAPDRFAMLDRAGRLIWGSQNQSRFVYSGNGRDTTRVVDLPLRAVRIPTAVRQAAYDTTLQQSPWLAGIAKLADIPATFPLWTAIAADGANNLWILLPGPTGPGDHWIVLDADGRFMGPVTAAFPDPDAAFWTRDRVYVRSEAPDGTPAILVYRIDRSRPSHP